MAGHGLEGEVEWKDMVGCFAGDFQPKNQKVSAARITDRTSWLSDSNDPRKKENLKQYWVIVIGDWHYDDRRKPTMEKAGLT